MLGPLQKQVAEIIASLDEAKDFALAGGGALIVRGDVQRQTRDLDFFGPAAGYYRESFTIFVRPR